MDSTGPIVRHLRRFLKKDSVPRPTLASPAPLPSSPFRAVTDEELAAGHSRPYKRGARKHDKATSQPATWLHQATKTNPPLWDATNTSSRGGTGPIKLKTPSGFPDIERAQRLIDMSEHVYLPGVNH